MANKNQKFGRNKRAPSNKAYTLGRRWEINKEKRAKREERKRLRLEKRKARPRYIKRGTARKLRRHGQKYVDGLKVE